MTCRRLNKATQLSLRKWKKEEEMKKEKLTIIAKGLKRSCDCLESVDTEDDQRERTAGSTCCLKVERFEEFDVCSKISTEELYDF